MERESEQKEHQLRKSDDADGLHLQPPSNSLWCSPAGHNLEFAHKMRVLDQAEQGWVDDEIATAAMKMLKSQYDLGGLRPTALFYGQTRAPSEERRQQLFWLRNLWQAADFKPERRQAQILYTGSLHWVLVSNYHQFEEELVYVYDSRDEPAPDFLINKVAAVYRFKSPKFRMSWPLVDQQRNNKDCGIYASAFLVALCNKTDPATVLLDDSKKLREHLVRCCEEGAFAVDDLFPTRSASTNKDWSAFSMSAHLLWQRFKKVRHRVALPDREIRIICECRMPPGKGRKDRNVMCQESKCDIKRFHESCIYNFDREFYERIERKHWVCPTCRSMFKRE
ncbi:uncharacterized protein LOC129584687 [Paramacrobiotus metropolitanus]|uniref:uncharacterized protein LOC129584687 n=1 Tax=Paramacrobiotus metropolitanus TaxID=2943436 RepID=UPI00244634B1|nr:uncharacterized protein LOC129584687 [Paramacrobiotus metropolitanus]